jgi:hypothetical protein
MVFQEHPNDKTCPHALMAMDYGGRRKDRLYLAGQPVGERLYRVIQRQAAG